MISIVIPTRNRAYTLKKVLDSCFSQRDVNEIVIVDDEGSDDTAAVFAQVGAAYPHVARRFVRNDVRQGASFGRLRGAREAANDYVLFCDDDEYLEPDYAAFCLEWLVGQNAGAVSGRRIYMMRGETREQALSRFGDGVRQCAPFDYRLCETVNGAIFRGVMSVPLTNSNILTRKDLVAKYGFDPHYQTGNGYREESDYQMNLFTHGYKLLVCNDVHSLHLPMSEVRTGGQRVNRLTKFLWSVRYNSYFLDKYYDKYRAIVGIGQSLWTAKARATVYLAWRNFVRPQLYGILMATRYGLRR